MPQADMNPPEMSSWFDEYCGKPFVYLTSIWSKIMASEKDLDLFGRVKNGEIVEFPVYRIHITNRSHPLDWYTPAVEQPKPELPPFSVYERTVELKDGYINVSYSVRAYTLEELLAQLRKMPNLEDPSAEPEVVSIAEVEPAMVQRIYSLASDYLTEKLVNFAATRGYGTPNVDAFTSLTTYKDSLIPKFKNEAARGLSFRDQAWANMLNFFGQVSIGAAPVPTTIAEIDALIPALTWED